MHWSGLRSPEYDTIFCMNYLRFVAAFIIASITLAVPLSAYAVGVAADAYCKSTCTNLIQQAQATGNAAVVQQAIAKCQATVCTDVTSSLTTTGTCTYPAMECQGKSSSGGAGNSGGLLDSSSLSGLGTVLGMLLGKLMQGQPGGGSGSAAGSMPYTSAGTTGCTGSYFQTSDISQLSNPCAMYSPSTTSNSPASTLATGTTGSTCDALSQLLGTCNSSNATSTGSPVTITNNNVNTNTNATPSTSLTTVQGTTTASTTSGLGTPAVLGPQSQSGNILFTTNGATIVGSLLNLPNNSTIAGFYGGDSFSNGKPQGIAASLCQSRPWANSFVSALIPSSFFDNLCSSNGYQVGAPPAPQVQLQQTPASTPKPAAPAAATTAATSSVPAVVQVWAVPASVPLDTRTEVYWATQGVTQCNVASPDGQFNENTLSGGAATVPLTGATTFTISCTDSSGNPITNYVTVNISS